MFALFGTANASLYTVVFDNDWTVQFDSDAIDYTSNTNGVFGTGDQTIIVPDTENLVDTTTGRQILTNYNSSPYDTRSSDSINFFDSQNTSTTQFRRSVSLSVNHSVFSDGLNLVDSLYVAMNSELLWNWALYENTRVADGYIRKSISNNRDIKIASISSVPVPGAVWLMGTALLGLVTKRKLV
jgi:hypothetical protein